MPRAKTGHQTKRPRRRLAAAFAALALLAAAHQPAAAEPASLIADSVTFDEETGLLTASGDVEVYYQGRVLRADTITFDRETEEIRARGPLSVRDPDGTILLADAAELSSDLRRGLIEGGQLLVGQQLQLAAAAIERTDERYTTLHRSVASSCTICAENPIPTWNIRARRITHDQVERRVYFDGARFEFFGVPVAYIPNLSIPDPTLERASGFLLPEYRQSDLYGSGVRLPYYLVLGPSADMTVTPFVTTGSAMLIDGEYRRRTRRGGFDVAGAFAFDDGSGETGRGAIAADGEFRLDRGYMADFELQFASDDAFLQEFDYSDADRLTSEARIYRVRDRDFLQLAAVGFQSLRADEDNSNVPVVLPHFQYYRRAPLPRLGGLYGLEANALTLTRDDGRDVVRFGGGANWQKGWVTNQGLVATATLRGDTEFYSTRDDPEGDNGTDLRAVPTAAAELSWPMLRSGARISQIVEPIVQVVYSEVIGSENTPNEDSQLPELDESSLFSLSRYPGRDEVETGLRAEISASITAATTPRAGRSGCSPAACSGRRTTRNSPTAPASPGAGRTMSARFRCAAGSASPSPTARSSTTSSASAATSFP